LPIFRNWFRSPGFAVLVLAAAVVAAYANSLQGPFVFDDYTDIIDNPAIRRLWPLGDLLLVRSGGVARLHTRPAVIVSFALDYAAGGLNRQPYHGTNLMIHLCAGLALFGVVRRALLLPRLRDRFGRASTSLALTAALLWAIHPLQTESVTYITQRYESMMGLFYLVAVYGVIRCGDSARPYRWGAVTVAATLLALASKEVAVSLPIVILLFDRVLLAGSLAEVRRRRWGMYAALLAVWTLFAAVQLAAGPRPWAGYALHVSWWEYARSQPGVVLHYLRLVFWPHRLVLDYGWPPAKTAGEIVPGAIAVGGLLAATAYAFWKCPPWGLPGAWFLLILAPTSSVLPLADLAFEHRMYLPLAAVVTAVVLGGYLLGQSLPRHGAMLRAARNEPIHTNLNRKRGNMLRPSLALRVSMVCGRVKYFTARAASAAGVCLVAAAALILGYLTFQRNQEYQNPIALWQDTVDCRPNNFRAHNNLGNELDDRGEFDEAVIHYWKALEINPNYVMAHYNLALALANHGRPDEARKSFQTALALAVAANDAALAERIGVQIRRCLPVAPAGKTQ
jgi:hypothetical protein